MRQIYFYLFIFLLLGSVSDAGTAFEGDQESNPVELYRLQLEEKVSRQKLNYLMTSTDRLQSIQQANLDDLEEISRLRKSLSQLVDDIFEIKQKVRFGESTFAGKNFSHYNFPGKWHDSGQDIHLQDQHFVGFDGRRKTHRVSFDRTGSRNFKLRLLFETSFSGTKTRTNSSGLELINESAKARLVCNEDIKIKKAFKYKILKANQYRNITIYPSADNLVKFKAKILFPNTSCNMSWKVNGQKYSLEFFDEDILFPEEKKYKSLFEVCHLPQKANSKLEKVFLSPKFSSNSCPVKLANHKLLIEKIEGLQAKARALLGQNLPEEMIKSGNPNYPIDYSLAPNLSGIYISYLVWRNDFFGSVMNRMIRYHAERGVPVKILVSKVISLKKDKTMLAKLDSDFPNVSVRLYRYKGKGSPHFRDALGRIHRTNHIKMFLAENADDKDKSVFVIGGRNIHDGFIFDEMPNLSQYEDLVHYGVDESKAVWTDFEIELRGADLVTQLKSQFYSFWYFDREKTFFRHNTVQVVSSDESLLPLSLPSESEGDWIRHMVSYPFSDKMQLEEMYVNLIDAAAKHIFISTPYFNLTPSISKAFERAVARGIKVEVITRLNLEGDIAASLLADVNKGQVNKFRKVADINSFSLPHNPTDILHSKLFIIDGQLSVIGSINFNQRSFFHDLENVSLIWSKQISGEVLDLLAHYKTTSDQVVEKQKIKWLNRIIINVFKKEF